MDDSIYFFIFYPRNEKENVNDIEFVIQENKSERPECIYSNEKYENKRYYYKKIFKFKKSKEKGKKGNDYYFEFEIDEDKYTISFNSKGNTFIFEVTLEVGKIIIPIRRKVNQNDIDYNEKIDDFIYALEKNSENDKIDLLYKDALDLYLKKKSFYLLIFLFVRIYQKKELCTELLTKFKEMNLNPKDKEKNMDRKASLKDFTSIIYKIISETDKLIENNNYNKIDFYGIILCYLNFYDYKHFSLMIEELFDKTSENLYEILLIYNAHFKNPINQNSDFFNKFIKYTIDNKEFPIFKIGLGYIKDLETFLDVIERNKEGIFEKYKKKNDIKNIFELDDKLKFKKFKNREEEENEKKIITGNLMENNIEEISNQKKDIKQEKEKNKKKWDYFENNIKKKIKSICKFSESKEVFLIYFRNDFWKYILNYYSEPEQMNIKICYELRNLFIEYYNLVMKIFGNKDNKFSIKNNAIIYFKMDEFAYLLDQIIKKYITYNESLSNIDKLAFITKYNPYYNEEKYFIKVNSDIFDSFNLDNIDNDFIEDFRKMDFENIFKNNIDDYIKKIFSKIKNISHFSSIIKLINIKNIENKNIILEFLNKSYDNIIQKEIVNLTDSKLNEAVKVVADLALINFTYEKNENKFHFIKNKIKNLDKNIIPKIFFEIIKKLDINKNEKEDIDENENIREHNKDNNITDFTKMKDFIFDEFSNKLDNNNDIDNILNFIDCLEEKFKNDQKDSEKKNDDDEEIEGKEKMNEKEILKNEFLKKLIDKNLFTKEEFFSNNQNLKISLIYRLYEKGKIKDTKEEYYVSLINLLNDIRNDLDGKISKKKLEEFLKNDESFIKERLSLIKLVLQTYNPNDQYLLLKDLNNNINKDIKKLKFIKDNIIIYFKETYKNIIKKLIDTIKDNQNNQIQEYGKGKIKDAIMESNNLQKEAEDIEKVKNFLLFNVIYEMNSGKDERTNFKNAFDELKKIGNLLKDNKINELYEKNKPVFDKIKEKLSTNEERAQEFIKKLKDYYGIEKEEDIDELTILFKSKKYDLDINSIIFFFENFQNDNQNCNDKLSEELQNYKDLSVKTFDEIKKKLNELKEKEIYDYKDIKDYNKFFTCLYNKKEAIEYLISKIGQKLENLKERIQPTDRRINIKDINDTEKCIHHISNMKKLNDNTEIFNYIKKNIKKDEISYFEKYSQIYQSIIELDRNEDNSENIYMHVIDIINEKLVLTILQDSENFLYQSNQKLKNITLEELVHLKNKIHINNLKVNDVNDEKDIMKSKCKILIFFKEIISNLEIIIGYMKILRTKGSSLPIKIVLICNKESIEYQLGDEKNIDFERIKKYLLTVKDNYMTQLDSLYKEKLNLRFIYGKQFRSMMKHLEIGSNIDSFLRYILNNTDNNTEIKEGYKTVIRHVHDYIHQYELYNLNSLESISAYITSLFKNNKTLEEHYKEIKIKQRSNDIYKGIYLHEIKKDENKKKEMNNNSMEEFIINLFWNQILDLPIAQNVLITNKETSSEEIQAFFHRSILCNYNTLFVIEINDSFSEYQQSIMNTYIDKILSYKKKYSEETIENFDGKKTQDYLDSCIVFVYEEENKNITSFLNEIKKLDFQKFPNDYANKIKENNKFLPKIGKIKIITSDICGLGKSEKIKKIINDNKELYFHFPLGGILNKSIIFDKLESLLSKIKDEIKNKNKNYKDVAIHLDLTESKEKSILNEFFFSFFITKFYTNNENIIYIPKDINIFVEIPNCFENYLAKFNILNIFEKENITFNNMPKFDYSEEMIKIFKKMLDIDSNEKIQQFVEKYIGIKKYSYHQINIFIKLFISQYNKTKYKIQFIDNGKDVTEKVIEKFAECTKYFTNGGFAQLLTGTDINYNNKEKKDYIEELSEIYDNDLKTMEFPAPLIFRIPELRIYYELFIPERNSQDFKNSKVYLEKIKDILNLPNEVENDKGELKSLLSIIEEKGNNYVITNDNFKKMVLVVYRISANVPVILMGDTGCGKTALIIKLNQILNNGETTVEIINIHPGINDEKLCEKMREINEKAKEEKQKNKELWVFFDEINTCLSLSLLTEIFINRTYNGNKLSDNIRLIGACNPYRRRKKDKEKCGLSMSDDNDNELVYIVEPLPQSLLYYVFSFGSIDVDDEKKYIYSIIENLFTKEEKALHEMTKEAISQCHIYLRKNFDVSVVSLREIKRFFKCVEFFKSYFCKKNKCENNTNNEKNNKIRSIICSIYLCYYIRLTDERIRNNFEIELRKTLLKLINNEIVEKNEGKEGNLIDQIKNEDLKKEISFRNEAITNNFSDFLKIEQEYLLNQIELDKGIGKNTLLKENIFLLFVSVVTSIPLIIIGKPGSGKSLSAQLITKSLRGKYSNNKFFQMYPKIIQTYFQGSESTLPEDVETLFDKAGNKLKYYKENKLELPISMILFDELGLAERSESNPLKVLHSKLEYGGKEDGVSFLGISNYSLDAAKINRALFSSVPDLDLQLDELIKTSKNIVESISDKIKNDKIFEILSNTYFEYKRQLQIIKELVAYKKYIYSPLKDKKSDSDKKPESDEILKSNYEDGDRNTICSGSSIENNNNNNNNIDTSDKKKIIEKKQFESIKESKEYQQYLKKENKIRKDFHGNRDFYYLIKGIANALGGLGDSNDNEKVPIIIKYIERNFGGIEYEIDIDFKLDLQDMREKIDLIKKITEDYETYRGEDKITKLSSIFLFKKLYNLQCDKLDPNGNLKIDKEKINDYNLNGCIIDNINDLNSRYLLLEIKQSLTTLIYQNITLKNPLKEIIPYEGSPFIDDNNKEYRFMKINEIQDDAKEDKLIVLENLERIYPFLFDLLNMNYQIIDDKQFARICLDNFDEQLTLVNKRFRIIIFVDKKFINKCDLAFLNRTEKMILSFDKLLDNVLKKISDNLIDEINFKYILSTYKNINFSLKDLLINCKNEEIQALIFYFSNELTNNNNNSDDEELKEKNINENQIKDNVINKIYKILPQDIICVLSEKNIIKKKYFELKNVFNFKDYIKEGNIKHKISIIYTYTRISNTVKGFNNEMSFMISKIKSEKEFINSINEIKNKNENNKLKKEYNICINFNQSNSKHIKFISNCILNNFMKDEYHYIIIIHMSRNFKHQSNERTYSLPDINPNIYQLFIDNLEGNNKITLNALLTKDIQIILEEQRDEFQLDDEFNKTLNNFIKKELTEKNSFDNDKIIEYIKELQNYMNEEESIKKKIIEMTYKLISKNDEEKTCQDIIDNAYNNNLIDKYTIDIVSFLIKYIKENIFNKYLKNVLKILEDNNILTTLIEIKKNDFKFIKKKLVEKIIIKYLDEITIEKNYKYECKFLYNYNVPGFYKFYINFSHYINKNITPNYFNNEKKLRELLKEDFDKIKEFHNNEESLINNVNKELVDNYKFIFDVIYEIPNDLIFKDYITYYLQKYKNSQDIYNKDDIYHKLIELLLKLRFEQKKEIENNNVNFLLTKIMWIESNVNYILNIFKIFENAMQIFNNDEKKLYDKMEELIFKEDKIKYITNEKKNPKHTEEVNKCYYLILASICYSITSDDIKMEINHYNFILKEINKILQNLNDDLFIFLKERNIIDELIKIIEIFKKNNDIKRINEIKNLLIENAIIIQKYADSDDLFKLSDELINNFETMYKLIYIKDKNKGEDYYDKLRYILLKEVKKISDINYRQKILEKIIEEKEMLKKSNDIFQIVLKNYVKKDKFEGRMNEILNGNDIIIKFIDQKLKEKNFVLEETLLYFFEKNSLNYLKNNSKNKNEEVYLEDEPLEILKKCITFLEYYYNKSEKIASKLKELCKLFCMGYIKTYCYTFIETFNDVKTKFKDPKKIVDIINGEHIIHKMIRIYIYKIFYNNYQIDFFKNKQNITKYKLEEYKDFNKFNEIIELLNVYQIDYRIKTIKDEYYEESYKVIEKYKNENFKKNLQGWLKTKEFKVELYGIDNFYVASYNSTLANLQKESSDFNDNFYNNICVPLFNKEIILLKAIELFYKKTKYDEIKEQLKINPSNLKPLLFGYRYCLNEISHKEKNIFSPLYYENNIKYLQNNFFPGNDTKLNSVYSDIKNHFKTKPEEGCYVCLCKNWYYYSVPSGFPEKKELMMNCPKCKLNIGALFKRDNYYRIFKDQNEINEIKKDTIKGEKMKQINCMTLEEFEEKYIKETFKNEKGVYITDKNNFKNDKKIVRNLSQVSYRLLNYILYTHLFFAKLITNKKEIDNYLPKGMKWIETLNECWNILKRELLKENIDSIEEFMNYIFVDLFNLLNKQKSIDEFEKLISFEDKLESFIKEMIKKFKNEDTKSKEENDKDKTSYIKLLNEKYTSEYYDEKDFPFYKYFYYTDYLNEKYINEKLSHMDENRYPVLKTYLDFINNAEENKYSLNNLSLFNNALNLINEKYFNNISREKAQKIKLKDSEIYINNNILIDKFIKFYNDLKINNNEGKNKELNADDSLCNFFIDDNNNFGRTYKNIYKEFIKQQNQKIENLYQKKRIFDYDNYENRISIQQINEKEIITLNLPKKVLFIDILFNSSYRKVIDTFNYKSYKEYEINYDFIEENMTDLLLKNKKLLNENITEFIYNNEIFNNTISDIITSFKKRYVCKDLLIHDKIELYNFYKENQDNINLHKNIINDFIELIKFLNNKRKENLDKKQDINDINEESKIHEVVIQLKDITSENFIKIFENKNKESFTINKTFAIFDYYLKCIYEDIKNEIKKYQEELNSKSKEFISDYYNKDHLITKQDFAYAIRMFITFVLFPEQDKEKKIQSNNNNLVNYLKKADLWKNSLYTNENFDKNLNELREIKAPINQIISLYEALGRDIEDNFFDNVKQKIQQEQQEQNKNNEDDEEDPFGKEEGSDEDESRDDD